MHGAATLTQIYTTARHYRQLHSEQIRSTDNLDYFMFKKCFSTLGCPDYSLDKVLDTAQAHGMDSVEIRALENEIDLPSYFIKNGITPEELKRRCHKSGNLP